MLKIYTANIYISSTSLLRLYRCTLHLLVVYDYKLQFTRSPLHLSEVVQMFYDTSKSYQFETVKNILPFGESMFTQVKYIPSVVLQMYRFSDNISSVVVELCLSQITSLSCVQISDVNSTSGLHLTNSSQLAVVWITI